jgi:hypothetical protein
MRGSKHDLPVAFEGTSMVSRQVEWGDLNVALETFPAGTDPSPLFKDCLMTAAPARTGGTSSGAGFGSGTGTARRS